MADDRHDIERGGGYTARRGKQTATGQGKKAEKKRSANHRRYLTPSAFDGEGRGGDGAEQAMQPARLEGRC